MTRSSMPATRRNGDATAFHEASPNGLTSKSFQASTDLLHVVDQSVLRFPNEPAILFRDRSLTYGELNSQANRMAHWLIARGIGPNATVAVSMRRSPEALVVILGILKSGGGYVPIDPQYPVERIERMLADATPSVLIMDEATQHLIPADQCQIAIWEKLIFALDEYSTANPMCRAGDEDLAYVLFTSGSTGRPKGVAMPRGPLKNLIDWQIRHSSAGPGCVTLQFASLSFDVSFQEIFSTWAVGGSLLLPQESERRDPAALIRMIISKHVNRLFCPFVVLQQLTEAWTEPPTCLTEIITAGEQLQITPAIRRFFHALPGCTLHNHYGPTESHVVTAHTLDGSPNEWPNLPPIGMPIDGAVIHVVDEHGQPAASGEIWIGGDCLAQGYWGRPELTAERFAADPFRAGGRVYRTGDLGRWNANGELEFLGRIDQQVKIRGYRVEPGEIEIALCGHPGIKEAAVIAREDTPGDRRLVAYVVLDEAKSSSDLRSFLAQRLPDFMVPAAFVELPSLPLTPSGKLDRKSLPAPSRERPALVAPFVKPRTKLEKSIAAIWADVLQLESIGIHDPFFELGGHSLALARVHARLRDATDIDLSITDLFRFPTIAGLAAELERDKTEVTSKSPRPKSHSLTEPIAIIGMAGRFPKAANIEEFWKNLCDGVEGISFFNDDELRASGIPDEIIGHPDYVKARGILAEADGFDAGFFGFQPREAELTDPQHRVFLETAWAAFESAGIVPEKFSGRIGVFAGASMNTYLLHNVLARREAMDGFLDEFQSSGYPILVGNDKDYLATRVAFKLNLHGPAVSIQTACSTSLVAVAEAVESLRSGNCDLALAGGVSITFPQKRGSLYQEGAITSPDGRCRPFDVEAKGTVFGEGSAIVVLKRLHEAIADGDLIYAVIKGVGLSNDGSDKVSFLAPSVDGQTEAFSRALAQADIDSASVGFIETHGTGTPLGDPIEVAALARVYKKSESTRKCRLGSVKSNIGHLEAAAGVTGLIKTALAIHHRRIPGTLHYRSPNPALELERTRFEITSETTEWISESPRFAAVTSLGVGGTNAHLVLEEAPAPSRTGPAWPEQLLIVSARTSAALETACQNLAEFLYKHPEVDLADVAYTLQTGRRHFAYRRFLVASSHADAFAKLTSMGDRSTTRSPAPVQPAVAFLFTGQGTQYVGMASKLYQAEPTFRAQFDLCCELFHPHLNVDLRSIVLAADDDDPAARQLNQTAITQPALFAIEYSLAHMFMGWGIMPAALFGHSIGEFVAACIAGVMSLESAVQLVARRGALIQACPPGIMLAVRASEREVRSLLPKSLDIAASNSPTQTVVSGAATDIESFESKLTENNVQCKRLATSHAFHSRLLEPAVHEFRKVAAEVSLHPPKTPLISCVTGTWMTEQQATSADYWASQLRHDVRCADGLSTLADRPLVTLELGPGQTLTNLARQVIPKQLADGISSLARDHDDVACVLHALGRLWLNGVAIEWTKFHALSLRRRVALPSYPFERQRCWIEPRRSYARVSEFEPAPQFEAPPNDTKAPPTGDRKSQFIAQLQLLFADLAGVGPEAIIPAHSFFELGFDSLFLTQAVQAIHQRFGSKLSFRQLLESVPTTEALAEYLDQTLPVGAGAETLVDPTKTIAISEEPVAACEQPAGFGAFTPIDRSTETEWSARQLQFLDSFVDRWTRQTAKSKNHVQAHRGVHADPRTVSGFTRLWKEIVYPIVVERSAGARLFDIDGNEYVDLLNGFGPDLLGHSPPFVVEAIEEQLRSGYEVGPMSPLAGELAAQICDMTGMDRASFVCTGSEAVQAALRAARTVTGRDKVVTFARDYHGNFDEVLLRPGGDPHRPTNPSAPGVPRSAVGNMIVLEYGTPESLTFIRQHVQELAAVLVEPVQSRRPEWQPREFLHQLRAITEGGGACLIFDEVITGFRLHPGGAQAYFDVKADLATYGKVIGGGMPIGAVAGRSKFMDAFDGGVWSYGDESFPTAGRTFFAGTFVRHPLALAAGLATLRHLQAAGPALQQRLNAASDQLVGQLGAIARAHRVPLEIVNCGSLMFFRVLDASKEASLLFYLLRERGVYILEGFPSYLSAAHSADDLRQIESAFRDSVLELRAHGFFETAPATGVPVIASDWVPLTDAQRELWLAVQGGDDSSRAFNESCALRINGPFDIEAFRRSVQKLVARHEALRATFGLSGQGQRFGEELILDVPLIDLSSLPAGDRDHRLQQLRDSEDQQIFDLANGPLLRVQIVRMSEHHHEVLITAHHIACDGWSYDIILHDLGQLYSAEIDSTRQSMAQADSFRTYALARAGRDSDRELHYWTNRLTPTPAPLELPSEKPRPNRRTFRGTRLSKPLGQERTHQVKQLGVRIGCTPYATMLALFEVLLSRLSGQQDIVLGIPTAGQTIDNKTALVGHCVHFLPIRLTVGTESPFSSFAQSVKTNLLDAFEHQNFTYVNLLNRIPNPNPARPLIAIGFNLDPALSDLGFRGVETSVEKNAKHFVNLELHWNLVDTGTEYVLEAEYNTDLYDADSIARWVDCYFRLIDHAAQRPDTSTGELQMLTASERCQLLVDWAGTDRPIPNRAVHEIFEEQAYAHPNAIALATDNSTMSYGELNRRANRLAKQLRERGVRPDVAVAVLLDRSPDLMVALLGILKAGGAYLPLDPGHPPARNARLITDARSPFVISSVEMVGHDALGVPVVQIEPPRTGDDQNLGNVSAPEHMAAVLYTSGSTGVPKGVMVTHRGIIRLLFNSDVCDFGPRHTLAFLAPVAFDAATLEIWGALLHGGKLAIYPETVPDPGELGQFLHRHHVDTLWLTAGLFNTIVDRNIDALSGIRQLLTGGEAMSLTHARRALSALHDTTIINGYGPTETTTFATTWKLPRQISQELRTAPIGRPIGNTTVVVLDRHNQPVPIGVIGELFIGGAGVARGYLNAAELTTERFVPSPLPELSGTLYRTGDRVRWRSDGLLEFLGRTDQQVKIRGHRIEPGEIESTLSSHPDVVQAAVIVQGSGADARLIAFVVAKNAAARDPDLYRKYLSERLAAYMVPSSLVFLDELPLTANGKLDRSNLPEPPTAREPSKHELILPRTDAELDLQRVWAEVLGQPNLSIDDNFFDLGGHSLKAIELISAVRDRLGHALPLGALYDAPTVAQFAHVIQHKLEAGSEHHLVPLREGGAKPALFMVAGVGGHVFAFHKFSRLLASGRPSFGVKAIGVDGTRPPPERVEDIAAEYVAEMMRICPNGPFILAGYSLGAVIAFEVALQLRQRGLPVPLLIAVDAAAPGYLNYSLLKRIRLHIANLFRQGGGWRYVKQRGRNLIDKLNWKLGRGHRNAPTIAGLEMYSQDAITQVWVALHKAYKVYQPAKTFDGSILVIRADVVADWDKFVSRDPNLGWSKWTTGPIEAFGINVPHLDLFHEPAIFELARIVDNGLSRFD